VFALPELLRESRLSLGPMVYVPHNSQGLKQDAFHALRPEDLGVVLALPSVWQCGCTLSYTSWCPSAIKYKSQHGVLLIVVALGVPFLSFTQNAPWSLRGVIK